VASSNCVTTFGDSKDGCKQRLLHLANDHQLPIFVDKKQALIESLQPDKLHLHRLGPHQLLSKHKQFRDSRNDNDLYFNWVGGSLSRHLKKNPQNDRNQ
jgi:hypothetical protein